MATRKTPARSRKSRGVVAVAGLGAVLGMYLQLASGGVTLGERVLDLVVKAQRVLKADANTTAPCEQPKR